MSGSAQRLANMPLALAIQETGANQWVASFVVDTSYTGIAEHFPNMPIVAGYLQLSWVEHFVKQVLPSLRIEKIIETKFSAQMKPPVEVNISITLQRIEGIVRFAIADRDGVKTQGRFSVGQLS